MVTENITHYLDRLSSSYQILEARSLSVWKVEILVVSDASLKFNLSVCFGVTQLMNKIRHVSVYLQDAVCTIEEQQRVLSEMKVLCWIQMNETRVVSNVTGM